MSVSDPQPSCHSKLRYIQRAGLEAPDMREAWTNAKPVEISYRDCRRARFHSELNVVLLEREDEIITVLRAQFEDFDILVSAESSETAE
jgi:hypothetical protein